MHKIRQLFEDAFNPTAFQYELIKRIYDDINEELLFGKPFLITEVNGAYAVRRCILESVVGGAFPVSSTSISSVSSGSIKTYLSVFVGIADVM